MDYDEYDQLRTKYLELEHLASTHGKEALKLAAKLYPRQYSKYVAQSPFLDYIDFESDIVVYERFSSGDRDSEFIPVRFLWMPIEEIEADILEQKRKDDEKIKESERLHKEAEQKRRAEANANSEHQELLLYRRLKRKYEKKP